MPDMTNISGRYAVRKLTEADAGEILSLCLGNPLFYRYSPAEPTREQILLDLYATPPGTDSSQKAFVGFYDGEKLIAVMDLVDGWPEESTVFIGFFMVDAAAQGKGVGSGIIAEAASRFASAGKTSVRLGIDKGNPQSAAFWKKNGFAVIREVSSGGRTVLVAERKLS